MPQGLLVEPQHLLLVREVRRHFALPSPSPSCAPPYGNVAAGRRRRAPPAAMNRAKLIGEGMGGLRGSPSVSPSPFSSCLPSPGSLRAPSGVGAEGPAPREGLSAGRCGDMAGASPGLVALCKPCPPAPRAEVHADCP